MKCPFCQIDTQKTRIVRESGKAVVFLSNPRLVLGHTLVIPKRHVEKPWELTSDELHDIFENIWWAESKLLASGLATGCDIRQNYRPFLPQSREKKDHIHFHVLPRTLNDNLYQASMRFEHDIFTDLPDNERQEIINLYLSA